MVLSSHLLKHKTLTYRSTAGRLVRLDIEAKGVCFFMSLIQHEQQLLHASTESVSVAKFRMKFIIEALLDPATTRAFCAAHNTPHMKFIEEAENVGKKGIYPGEESLIAYSNWRRKPVQVYRDLAGSGNLQLVSNIMPTPVSSSEPVRLEFSMSALVVMDEEH